MKIWSICLLLGMLSCSQREPEPHKEPKAQEPQATKESPSQEEIEDFIRSAERLARLESTMSVIADIEAARALAADFAERRLGPQFRLSLIGTGSGHPAFWGQSERAHFVCVVLHDEVLLGEVGFWRFLERTKEERPPRIAAAWLLLSQGLATEPLNVQSLPSAPSPSQSGAWIHFSYATRHGVKQVEIKVEKQQERVVVRVPSGAPMEGSSRKTMRL